MAMAIYKRIKKQEKANEEELERIRKKKREEEALDDLEKEEAERESQWQKKYDKARKQCSAYGKEQTRRKHYYHRHRKTAH